jgi:hypothetical protein
MSPHMVAVLIGLTLGYFIRWAIRQSRANREINS